MYMGESWTASHPHSHLLEGLYTLSPADLSAPTPGPEGRVLARHWRVEEAREHLPTGKDGGSVSQGWWEWGDISAKIELKDAKGIISSTLIMNYAQSVCWDQIGCHQCVN